LARASTSVTCRSHAWGCDSPARLAPRHDIRDAAVAITTEDGTATLLLTRDVVALQLSDHTFKRIMRSLRDKEYDDDDIAFAAVIKHAVISTVRSALDQSAECPIREIRTVSYRDGRLEFLTMNGRYVFGSTRIDGDEDTLSGFTEHDAIEFVREFQHVKDGIQ
jgi:hypothetical protein